MEIEEFIQKSLGKWKSMRSGHSLAFQQFEEVISTITITVASKSDEAINQLIIESGYRREQVRFPFKIEWNAQSNWDQSKEDNNTKGSSIIIPIPTSKKEGVMIRTSGYSENMNVLTNYNFSKDGTIFLKSKYEYTIAEERIWFISENLRCRSSVLKSSKSSAILQTSFASEIKKLKL